MIRKNNLVYGINGPVITIKDTDLFFMSEMVYVGKGLVGEVIGIQKEKTVIQVYEDTTNLAPGDEVVGTGIPMSVLLGPGLLGRIFDGIQRPLDTIKELSGPFIPSGFKISALDENKIWNVIILVSIGDKVSPGFIFGKFMETSTIEHRLIIPNDIEGEIIFISLKKHLKINDTIVSVKNKEKTFDITLVHHWPIRRQRPFKNRRNLNVPLITGQRVIDTLFPIPKGGCAIIPGGFGVGKTVIQHQLAKWSDADIIVYVGCGERGNEMTQVLEEFTSLIDPKSGKSMVERTIFIANTSNMPVAAREASIYTAVTIAEYYRDMGYNVALMADSTSRWAEALREISGRLEEIPAEEGFPAYLPSRISEFYERSGNFTTLNGDKSSVTLIGAVSPQGADFSEPVTQNSKRFTRCFWALDKSLAYARHYPAINWNLSYSEYFIDLDQWFAKNYGLEFIENRKRIFYILKEEERLSEIVKLIGHDILPDSQKLVLASSRLIRMGFLQQNTFNKYDRFVSISKQKLMIKIILYLHEEVKKLILASVSFSKIFSLGVFEEISKIKYEISEDELEKFDLYFELIDKKLKNIIL